jgi:predicted HAD superfamily Cof-like phosphohydrolase
MEKNLSQVVEWHKSFDVPVEQLPIIPNEKRVALRISLLKEELNEFIEAANKGDLVAVADAFADLQYVLMGAIVEFGLHEIFDKIFDEVHSSNMSKLDEEGKPILREDGKILKSNLFRKPDLRSILIRYQHEKGYIGVL